MEDYNENLREEEQYLEDTLDLIRRELERETQNLSQRKNHLIAANKDMWENSAHFSTDFEKLTEVNQRLSEVTTHTNAYSNTHKNIEKYKKMLGSPYFGRFDFVEDDSNEIEKIYLGIENMTDPKTQNIYVYDWRAPVSSMFYRYEQGNASYKAPFGNISGKILLKRQYKIQSSELKYFFDCNLVINDEILQQILGRNASSKMKSIVETIQKEQDVIIRDTENELLVVQGAAGSGKTSIAMHRIAFLLYEGMDSKLGNNDIIIISPNSLFSGYISTVLPQLGEDNVEQATIEEIFNLCFEDTVKAESRNSRLESIIECADSIESTFIRQCLEFKGSSVFVTILERFLQYFERKLLEFQDIYYDGAIIENRQLLKSSFLNNKIGMPAVKRLKRLESKILEKLHPLQKKRLQKIEKIVQQSEGHEFDIKPFSRLLSIKEARAFKERIHKFTIVDSYELYMRLFKDRELFARLSQGLDLPPNIGDIISYTANNLKRDKLFYEDALGLLYIKLKIEGWYLFSGIKQVVIDEAQDYYPIHYEIFKTLFNNARFTVVGDIGQTIEKSIDVSFYDDIIGILNKGKAAKLFLSKSYRSSYEINRFAQKILNASKDIIFFERHEDEPGVVYKDTEELLQKAVIGDSKEYIQQGFESVAIICKTKMQAEVLYNSLKDISDIRIMDENNIEIEKGIVIIPVYLAKGLEFDAVLVYGTDRDNYSDEFDRRLLYIACTRALHRLALYYYGDKSLLIP